MKRKEGPLTCYFGEPWLGPHPLCRAETARICGKRIEDVLLPDWSRYREEPEQRELFAVEERL